MISIHSGAVDQLVTNQVSASRGAIHPKVREQVEKLRKKELSVPALLVQILKMKTSGDLDRLKTEPAGGDQPKSSGKASDDGKKTGGFSLLGVMKNYSRPSETGRVSIAVHSTGERIQR